MTCETCVNKHQIKNELVLLKEAVFVSFFFLNGLYLKTQSDHQEMNVFVCQWFKTNCSDETFTTLQIHFAIYLIHIHSTCIFHLNNNRYWPHTLEKSTQCFKMCLLMISEMLLCAYLSVVRCKNENIYRCCLNVCNECI